MKFLKLMGWGLLSVVLCGKSYAVHSYDELEKRILKSSANPHTQDTLGYMNEGAEIETAVQDFMQFTVWHQLSERQVLEAGAIMRELKKLSLEFRPGRFSGDFVAQFDLIGHWLDYLFQVTAGYYKKVNLKCAHDKDGNIKKSVSKEVHAYIESQLNTILTVVKTMFGPLDENNLLKFSNKWVKHYALLYGTDIKTNDIEAYRREQDKRTLFIQVFEGCRLLARLRGYAACLYTGENKLDERFNIVGVFIEPIIHQLFNFSVRPLFGHGGELFENMKAALWDCLLMPVGDDQANKNLFLAFQRAQLWMNQNNNSSDIDQNTIQCLRCFLKDLLDGNALIKASSPQAKTFIQAFFDYLNGFKSEILEQIIVTQHPDVKSMKLLLAVYLMNHNSFWKVDSLIVSNFLNIIRKLNQDTQEALIKNFALLRDYNNAARYVAGCDVLITRYHAVMNFVAIGDYLVEMGYADQITFFELLAQARGLQQEIIERGFLDLEAYVGPLDQVIQRLERQISEQAMAWLRKNTNQGEVIQNEVYGLPEVSQNSDWIAMENLRASLINLFEKPSAGVITGGSF
jgi:hypothetical protein